MIFLAQNQNSYSAYQDILVHPEFGYVGDNPYLPANLLEIGRFFVPFSDSVWWFFIGAMVMGVLFLWVYRRVNDTEVFEHTGWTLVAFAMVMLIFFRGPFPNWFGMLLLTYLTLAVLVNLVTILAVAAVQKLPYMGVDEKLLADPRDGSVKPHVLYGLAVLIILGVYLFIPPYGDVARAALQYWPVQGSGTLLMWGIVLPSFIFLTGFLALHHLPWRLVPGQTVLGGGPLRELAPIFRMDGPAPRGEVVLVALATFLIFASSLFLLKGAGQVSGADVAGLMFMSALAFTIMRAELNRSKMNEQAHTTLVDGRRASPWGRQ